MKTLFLLSILFISLTAAAQDINSGSNILPLKADNSVMFGKDIIIREQPDQNQNDVVICSAYNGWLYAAYWYFESITPKLVIMRSIDDGMNWLNLTTLDWFVGGDRIYRMDICATGQTESQIKIILCFIYNTDTPIYSGGPLFVSRFDGNTGDFEGFVFDSKSTLFFEASMACDEPFVATSASPNSIAILYSFNQGTGYDSISVRTSDNGGLSFNSYQPIAKATHRYKGGNLSLTYGNSPSFNSGRYFAVWQEVWEYMNENTIYTAHSEPFFNSPFTTPVRLDNLVPSTTNVCRNPVIACQNSSTDNDSSDITAVVVFEKFIPGENRWELAGCYNRQAVTSETFVPFSITTNQEYHSQPDICFNPYSSTFNLTYFDSTNAKLPLVSNDINMTNPNSWTVESPDYHDMFNLASPKPRINVNFGKQDIVNVWAGKQNNGNKAALFDAPYSTYTGLVKDINSLSSSHSLAYPVPCSQNLTIAFSLHSGEPVNIELYDSMGQRIKIVCNWFYDAGRHEVNFDISGFPSGVYYYKFQSGELLQSGVFQIVK